MYTCYLRTPMRAFAKKYLVWVWMTAVLTATVGVSVHEVYCYCKGKARISLFGSGPENGCAAKAEPSRPDCCKHHESAAPKSCCAQKDGGEPDCTKKSVQVFQLKSEYTVDQPAFFFGKKNFDFPLWLHDVPMFKRCLRPAFCAVEVPAEQPQPPPPLSGREVCLRHCLYRC